jgi:23S rRNA pseudouridine1911/1915/1917 synthase
LENHFLVGEEQHGERLDKFLAGEMEDVALSRERIQDLIREGRAVLNGQPIRKPALRLKEGDAIALTVPEARPIALEPDVIPLPVVYEDADLLVVNKPAGMLTHPTGQERRGTLVNALLAHCGGSLSGINGLIRPGIVHRLDRDTSGLLVVAKHDAAHVGLSVQIKEKSARRDYHAIVQGRFAATSGTVDAPIGRNPKHRDRMGVIPGGRPARTHWRVKETLGDKFAWLDVSLETGRTHQIRVHMAHIGRPLVGDPLYGNGIDKVLKLKTRGQLLQAYRLAFRHPVGGQPMRFELDPDPELLRVWDFLRESAG